MSRELKKGDRMRVTRKSRLKDYQLGDVGEVLTGPEYLPRDRQRYYLVTIYKRHLTLVVFSEDEIEADA
jgi:hypothetical protein